MTAPEPLTDLDALLTGVVAVDLLPFLLPVPCVGGWVG